MMKSCCNWLCASSHNKAYVLIQLAFGIMMLIAGISKFTMGISVFVDGTSSSFAPTILGSLMPLVKAFLWALPFVELALGIVLLSFWKKKEVLFATAILLILFMIGLMAQVTAH